ncbi:MAG: MoaD family protein [Candidatus Methanofastidiosia archaeon]
MIITVSFLAQLREIIGNNKVVLNMDSATIDDVIALIGIKYGNKILDEILEDGKLSELVVVMRNGNITYDLKEKLEDGDEITFLPPAFGG